MAGEQLAMDALGTLRDRTLRIGQTPRTSSENSTSTTHIVGDQNDRVWARIRYDRLDLGKGQFELNQNRFLFQGGSSVHETTRASGTDVQTGLLATFASSRADAKDNNRPLATGTLPLSAHVGEIDAQLFSVGAYHTYYFPSSLYLDFNTQLGHLRNKYRDIENVEARHSGWSAAISAEVGKPLTLGARWQLEPQAQIIISHTRMDGFNDGLVHVDASEHTLYRARAGARLANLPTPAGASMFAIANIWYDNDTQFRNIMHGGTDTISVKPVGAAAWFEFGAGANFQIGKTSSLFFDVRGQRAVSNGKRNSVAGQLGWRSSW